MRLPFCFIMNHVGNGVLGSKQYNLSAIAVTRSLGNMNVPIVLLTTSKSDAVIDSKYTKHVELYPSMHKSESHLLEHLLKLSSKYPGDKVLLPVVDECAYFVGKYYEELKKCYRIPAPNWKAVERINNKKLQYESAAKLNIPIPETWFPTSLNELSGLAEKLKNYPYVIKPNVSFEWKMASAKNIAKGKKGIQVNNSEEMIRFGQGVFVPGLEFMVQEVIGGRDERLVTFLGYFDRNNKPSSWFIRKKIRQSPIDFGYCTFTESCHNDIVFDQSVRLLEEVGYYGIAGVEWKLDPEADTYKLIEINGRPVNTTGCAVACGVDLPSIAYFDAIGQPLPAVTNWKDGQRWAWLAMDFWSAKELIKLKRMTWRSWFLEVCTIKEDAVFTFKDLSMSLIYYSGVLKLLMKSFIKKHL